MISPQEEGMGGGSGGSSPSTISGSGGSHCAGSSSGGSLLPGSDFKKAMTSSIISSVMEPPNSTPHAGMGVPGRPRSIVKRTTSSSQRVKTLLSGGAWYMTTSPDSGSV
jgi:hypothetical protein